MLNTNFSYTTEQQQKLEELKKLLDDAFNLIVGREDVFLSKFLFYKNWDVEKALDSIYAYYNFKVENPQWMAHHPVSVYREEFLDIKAKFLMPRPDKQGRPILVFKMVDAFKKYPNYLFDLIEMDDMVYEALLLLPATQENGVSIILDMSGFTRNFLPLLQPRINRPINEKNKILPLTKRTIHFIQSGLIANTMSSLIMPTLDKEFKANVLTHDIKNLQKLHDIIGSENLPAEYGGPNSNKLDVNFLWNLIEKNADYLLQIQSYTKVQAP